MTENFYVIRRNDGHIFIQRYVPRDYKTSFEVCSYEKLAAFETAQEAHDFIINYVLGDIHAND
jgi:hypothetical protein